MLGDEREEKWNGRGGMNGKRNNRRLELEDFNVVIKEFIPMKGVITKTHIHRPCGGAAARTSPGHIPSVRRQGYATVRGTRHRTYPGRGEGGV